MSIYGVLLWEESERMMSMPFFLTAARTVFADPISMPIVMLRLTRCKAYQWQLQIPYSIA